MKHLALGWACNLNDIFVRFPYEKYKSLMKNFKNKALRKQEVKRVFRAGVQLILNDIIENNVTFKINGLGAQKGEIHFEAITGSAFEHCRQYGKFQDVDFLESLFTGYQLYFYFGNMRNNYIYKRKVPVYVGKPLKDKITEYTNQGRSYC